MRLCASTVLCSSLFDISTCTTSTSCKISALYMRLQKVLVSSNLTLILWVWQGCSQN